MDTTAVNKTAVDSTPEDRPTAFDVSTARHVLRMEADGVLALADNLGEAFVEAVRILVRVTGRVVRRDLCAI